MDCEAISEAARQRIGKRLKEQYLLDALIGIGGTAAVYSATHRNGCRYAVKIPHQLSSDFEPTRCLARERVAANAVGHPAAVVIFGHDADGELEFLIMELLEGESLQSVADAAGGRLPVDEVVAWTSELLDCLERAHENGVVHRDLKPDNLFVTSDGRLRLLDFGTARVRALEPITASAARPTCMGTVAFMSPEQARGGSDQADARSDIWSVGAILFTLLSGRHVHEAETTHERLALRMVVPAGSVAAVAPELPRELVAIVDRALAFEPQDRWQSAAELRSALNSGLRRRAA